MCDDGNDLGIDAVYIDEDNIVHFYQFKNPQRMEKGLPEGEVDSILSGLQLILNKRHEGIANEDLKGRIDEIYQTVPSGYRLHLVTSGAGTSKAAEEKLNNFVAELGGPSKTFFTWRAPYQVRAADHDCYMFHLDGTVLAQLYGQHGEQLLQQNIRVYQGDKATNASIKQTSVGDDSADFFHYNNGVTFLCEGAGWDQFISTLTLDRGQIVNGGQTIRVLYGSHREATLKEDVLVPVRVITSQGTSSSVTTLR